MSVIVPSVSTTTPTVAWSSMTLRVPISAACSNGMSSSSHGVVTMRVSPSSSEPIAPGTRKPTQSTRRMRAVSVSSSGISIASFGTNFGCVVMTVLPLPDCGSSSISRVLLYSFSICGSISVSAKRLMNVDLPVRTGPITPR